MPAFHRQIHGLKLYMLPLELNEQLLFSILWALQVIQNTKSFSLRANAMPVTEYRELPIP